MERQENVSGIDVYADLRGKIGLTAEKTSVDILRIDGLSFSSKAKVPFMFSFGTRCTHFPVEGSIKFSSSSRKVVVSLCRRTEI